MRIYHLLRLLGSMCHFLIRNGRRNKLLMNAEPAMWRTLIDEERADIAFQDAQIDYFKRTGGFSG